MVTAGMQEVSTSVPMITMVMLMGEKDGKCKSYDKDLDSSFLKRVAKKF